MGTLSIELKKLLLGKVSLSKKDFINSKMLIWSFLLNDKPGVSEIKHFVSNNTKKFQFYLKSQPIVECKKKIILHTINIQLKVESLETLVFYIKNKTTENWKLRKLILLKNKVNCSKKFTIFNFHTKNSQLTDY